MKTSVRKPYDCLAVFWTKILHSPINHCMHSGNGGGAELHLAVTKPERHPNFLWQEISSFLFMEPKIFFSDHHKHDCMAADNLLYFKTLRIMQGFPRVCRVELENVSIGCLIF